MGDGGKAVGSMGIAVGAAQADNNKITIKEIKIGRIVTVYVNQHYFPPLYRGVLWLHQGGRKNIEMMHQFKGRSEARSLSIISPFQFWASQGYNLVY